MLIDEKILPLLPKRMKKIMNIYLKDEFKNKIIKNDEYKIIEDMEIIRENPVSIDGKLIKVADHFAAFVEAIMSIYYGIKSIELEYAINELKKKYKDEVIYDIKVGKYFREEFFEF
jgi:putative hydrolase of HD superfamily